MHDFELDFIKSFLLQKEIFQGVAGMLFSPIESISLHYWRLFLSLQLARHSRMIFWRHTTIAERSTVRPPWKWSGKLAAEAQKAADDAAKTNTLKPVSLSNVGQNMAAMSGGTIDWPTGHRNVVWRGKEL